ncbi:metallophosphoesterase family protein [Sphingosinicella sp. LY1275]|uniref:metallophosphoesterase family protein n=1 Tax=Sphingosinicella sp. LY1275 TaxID=3095379 RepID=UPI002ADEE2D1|nr:metallophosphoesterase family protein [Sphingosinicella sp. LY1275]MEA1014492.1 metallophosphoesterase family protein [Sphingosinicella sp. LY1275]
MVLKRILSIGARRADRLHAVPDGQRIYAIGDVHGCLGLLDDLIAKIDADDAMRGKAPTRLIFLGDLIDRGPDSRGVVERVSQISKERPDTVLLKGNHEEILLLTHRGDRRAASLFHRVGGRATLLSYGVPADDYDSCDTGDLPELVRRYVPEEHIAFLASFEDFYEAGDYLFVHAGVRPGVPLLEQKKSDLRWIRSEFLDHQGSHGRIVVHGHSISAEVEERPNRIGIDTGGYASGQLTAVGLEGSDRWYLKGARP